MPDVVLLFEVHQPRRLRGDLPEALPLAGLGGRLDLERILFDEPLDKLVITRAAKRCYLPANRILLEAIDEHRRGSKRFKASFSISGVFLEQCERWAPEVVESFRALADTGMVEFLEQTYYHSLASMLPEHDELMEQLRMHRELMKDLLGVEPRAAENTEMIFNNRIAGILDALGYRVVVTEGVERVLGWRSPNYVYRAKGYRIKVLTRNYRLSDDVGFRFSDRSWSEYPLTADKWAEWVSVTPGDVIVVAMDYETFGEHHHPSTGIHEFLRWLPRELLRRGNVETVTVSEAAERHEPRGELDVPEWSTISWADERDLSAWLGNEMQWRSFKAYSELEPYVKALGDPEILRTWRLLGVSDHYYYMATKGGAVGDVHSYFSPLKSPLLAYKAYMSALTALSMRVAEEASRARLRLAARLRVSADKAFRFYEGPGLPLGVEARSLRELLSAVATVPASSLAYHLKRGDVQAWLRDLFGLDDVASALDDMVRRGLGADEVRRRLVEFLRKVIEAAREE